MISRRSSFQWLLIVALVLAAVLPGLGLAAAGEHTAILMSPADYQRAGDLSGAIHYGSYVYVEADAATIAWLNQAGIPFVAMPEATVIGLHQYRFDPRLDGAPALPSILRGTPDAAGALYLVQLAGPTRDEWLDGLRAAGAQPIRYQAQHSYVVWMNAAQADAVALKPYVRWMGFLEPGYRLHANLFARAGTIDEIGAFYYDERATPGFGAEIAALGGDLRYSLKLSDASGLYYLEFTLPATQVIALGNVQRLMFANWMSSQRMIDDEVSTQIEAGNLNAGGTAPSGPGYEAWLTALGANGTGVMINVVDSGAQEAHIDLAGGFVVHLGGVEEGGHGTHVAGIAVGRAANGAADAMGFKYGLGVAPGATYIDNYYDLNHEDFTRECVTRGCILTTNSWNTGAPAGYTAEAALYDSLVRDGNQTAAGIQPVSVVFSAGNAGGAGLTQPHEAKNIVAVAAARNWRDGIGNPGTGDINSVGGYSSRGPCLDGRLCPPITAMGTNVSSARDSRGGSCTTTVMPLSTIHSLCTGTSMSTPQVAGAMAVLEEWWRDNHAGASPSPAMRKAILINSATDMAAADIPNNIEGWGRLNMGRAFTTGVPIAYVDQTSIIAASGEILTYDVTPSNPAQPLKVSLVWSDAPGAAGGNAWVNNLDLRLRDVTSAFYWGNNFSAGWSAVGGTPDIRNNMESVYIQSPGAAPYRMQIFGTNIAGDGVPGNADTTDQDFALVCWNCTLTATSPTAVETLTVSAQPAGPAMQLLWIAAVASALLAAGWLWLRRSSVAR